MNSLIYHNDDLQGKPGLHAFIVGVSVYPNLPPPGQPLTPNNYGLHQLSSAATTAYMIYRWLLDHQQNLSVPLATCRLLLSPTADEIGLKPALNGLTILPTRDNFLIEAKAWQQDAASQEDNMTLFYFVGHGVQRTKDDAILLLYEFGDGVGGPLDKAVAINDIFKGMTSSIQFPHMAQKQLYFVDACRDFLSAFKGFEPDNPSQVFRSQLAGEDTRVAPIYYAAAPGTGALAIPGGQTLFSKALIECLEGAAGQFEDVDGQERWHVSVHSLAEALQIKMQELNTQFNAQQDFLPGGWWKDATICFLDQAPLVEVTLTLDPPEALPNIRLKALPTQGDAPNLGFPLQPYPYQGSWPAGFYTFSAEVDPPQPLYINLAPFIRQVTPPHYSKIVRVIP